MKPPSKRERLFTELCRAYQESGIQEGNGISLGHLANVALDVLGVKAVKERQPLPTPAGVSASKKDAMREKWRSMGEHHNIVFTSRKGKVYAQLLWSDNRKLDDIHWNWYTATNRFVHDFFPKASSTSGGMGSVTFRLNP